MKTETEGMLWESVYTSDVVRLAIPNNNNKNKTFIIYRYSSFLFLIKIIKFRTITISHSERIIFAYLFLLIEYQISELKKNTYIHQPKIGIASKKLKLK